MNPVIIPSAVTTAVTTAIDQSMPVIATATRRDIAQFETALASYAKSENSSIARFEAEEKKINNLISDMTNGGLSSNAMLDFQHQSQRLYSAYEITSKGISLMSKSINELTHIS